MMCSKILDKSDGQEAEAGGLPKCKVFLCCVVGTLEDFPPSSRDLPNGTFRPEIHFLLLGPLSVCLLLSAGLRPGALSPLHSLQSVQTLMGPLTCFFSQGFKDNLHAVFCLAENAVGPNATRPDDIHLLYSGK